MNADPKIRELTNAEVGQFQRNGWVFAKQYVSAPYVAQLLAVAKKRIGFDPASHMAAAPKVAPTFTWYQNVDDMSGQLELFRLVGRSEQTGRNVEKLYRRKVGVRYWIDNLSCKLPISWGSTNGPTTVHQDAAHFPIDRSGIVTCWIALDHVAPEQGSMRFYEGSHRNDVLGDPGVWRSTEEILEVYPWIKDYPISPPLTYEPGDATFHHSHVVHGAPANSSDAPRWNYTTAYVAADARYNGAFCAETNGRGLQVNEPIPHELFPLVWKGSDGRFPSSKSATSGAEQ